MWFQELSVKRSLLHWDWVINQDTSNDERPTWESWFKREIEGTTWRFNSFVDTAFISPFVFFFSANFQLTNCTFYLLASECNANGRIAQLSGQKEKSKQSESKLQSKRLRHPKSCLRVRVGGQFWSAMRDLDHVVLFLLLFLFGGEEGDSMGSTACQEMPKCQKSHRVYKQIWSSQNGSLFRSDLC